MTKKSTSANSKTAAELRRKKQLRRRWLTFVRMCRYGVNNFSRNAWLTIAATAVMTITLLVVFATLISRQVLLDTVGDIKKKVDISIYLKSDVSSKTVEKLSTKLTNIDSQVQKVTFITTEEAKQKYIKENDPSQDQLDALGELKNSPFPATLRVTPKDLNDISQVKKLVSSDEDFQQALDPTRQPSFDNKKQSIATIGGWISAAEKMGLAASAIFISISILIIFNTIRMAIYNRKEEIEMMKLIGAEKSFIQGPFIVESMMYGFFAAILAFIIGFLSFVTLQPKLHAYGIAVDGTYNFVVTISPFIIIGLIIIGSLIGVISSFFAVNRHLKIN